MELFSYLVDPIFHLVLILVPIVLKLVGVLKWSWLMVLIPFFIVLLFWIVAIIAMMNMFGVI